MFFSVISRAAAALALAALLLSCDMVTGGGASKSKDGAETSAVSAEVLRRLEGNYAMKMVTDGKTRYSTATVKELAVGQFQIARITVYGPVYYGFLLSGDGTVHSEELGDRS